jgi:hypothetical protein
MPAMRSTPAKKQQPPANDATFFIIPVPSLNDFCDLIRLI